MYAAIAKAQMKAVAVLFAVLAAAGTAAGTAQAIDHHTTRNEIAAAGNRAHFWRVIAGEEAPNAPTVDNALAKDLKERLGPIDRNASELPDEIKEFRGSSNTYGGITDAIGTDPFDSQGAPCLECGPLDAETQRNLLEIKRGHVNDVLRRDTPLLDETYTLTPWGLSGVETAGLIWVVGGPLTLVYALKRTRAKGLDWRLDGNDPAAKALIQFIALPAFAVHRPVHAIRRRRFLKRVRECYPEHTALLAEVDHMLDRASLRYGDEQRVIAVQAARDELQQQLESLTRSREAGDLDVLVENMESRLVDIKQSLEIRKEVLKELDA